MAVVKAAALPPIPTLDELPPMDVAGRIDRLRSSFEQAACDAVLVTDLINIRYLTGFTGSAALLFVGAGEIVFVTDGRYAEQTNEQLAAAGVVARIEVSNTDQRDRLVAAVAAAGIGRLGLEADDVSWSQQRRFDDEWFPDIGLVATSGLVEALRIVKDEGEVARIEAAAIIADHALAAMRPRLADHPTEADFGLELDTTMRRLGASGPSFETIIGSGPNGAKPHARPSSRRIADGDLVVIDFGAIIDGYCSDMTRTVVVGEIDTVQQRMLDVVTDAQQAGVDAVRAGVASKDVDAACRDLIEDAGWGDAFLHGTGHGVGLQIHEPPRVARTADATLAAGQIVTVEPGVYLPEHGGVRVEDTLLVTAQGSRVLTHTAKER